MLYNGLAEITLNDQEMADFYQHKNGENQYALLKNQYLLIKDENGDIVDKYKWDGERLVDIKFVQLNSELLGKIKPRNIKQQCYLDALEDDSSTVKCVIGGQGTGKSFLSTAWAVQQVINQKFDRLVVLRNNIELKGTRPIGFLPGSIDDKIFWTAGHILNTIPMESYERMCACGEIEVFPLNFVRGKSFNRCAIFLSEAQNTDVELIQTIVGRVGEDSILIVDGDLRQADLNMFGGMNNGLIALSRSLAGNELFSIVELDKVERSKTSALAELIK